MSFKMIESVMNTEIKPVALKCVMLVLAHFSDDNGDNCHPSHETIAKYSGMSRTAVKETIEKLCKAGLLLKQERRENNKRQTSNAYKITL
ncbi:TPA: helix-turn-helix domain-containing protein [Escherichia coli]|nr:helix-turn-helix domain-containing protein [Escherichia coli]